MTQHYMCPTHRPEIQSGIGISEAMRPVKQPHRQPFDIDIVVVVEDDEEG